MVIGPVQDEFRAAIGEGRRDRPAAMETEFDIAVEKGKSLPFASGCPIAAWRDMLSREEGRSTLTSYALALGLMLPMAAVQIGCALFGLIQGNGSKPPADQRQEAFSSN